MSTYLTTIIEAHRASSFHDQRSVDAAIDAALAAPTVGGFETALRSGRTQGLSVIAEIKRRSPSLGALREAIDIVALASSYRAGGARAMSVLTDGEFFGGSPDDLRKAKAVASLPVIRKDFTIDERDVADARVMGADCVLLIAAVLDDHMLMSCLDVARHLGIDALVEVHDEGELERAVASGATMIGVNQRDLVTFSVDTDRAVALAGRIPADLVAVGESGIKGADDARRLAAAGYDAILVGETLVKAEDPIAMVEALSGHPIGVRS